MGFCGPLPMLKPWDLSMALQMKHFAASTASETQAPLAISQAIYDDKEQPVP